MPYSEMDNSTLALLPLISERARKEPKLQFTSLAHLLNKKFLRECYLGLGRDRASGIDGVSWQAYGENLDENLANLVKRMKAKQYRPQPAKRVYIPKNEHEKQPQCRSGAECCCADHRRKGAGNQRIYGSKYIPGRSIVFSEGHIGQERCFHSGRQKIC